METRGIYIFLNTLCGGMLSESVPYISFIYIYIHMLLNPGGKKARRARKSPPSETRPRGAELSEAPLHRDALRPQERHCHSEPGARGPRGSRPGWSRSPGLQDLTFPKPKANGPMTF